jgi:hypothetical protein
MRNRIDQAEIIYERDQYLCICGNSVFSYGTPQLAHRIPQRKHLIETYGKDIIHHPCNLRATCCLDCNGQVSVAQNMEGLRAVLQEIREYELAHGGIRLIGKLDNLLNIS